MGEKIPVQENFIVIDKEKCVCCGNCITICGGQVFEIKDGKAAVVHIDRCLECWNCEVVCAADAIQVQVPAGGSGIIYICG